MTIYEELKKDIREEFEVKLATSRTVQELWAAVMDICERLDDLEARNA